MHEYFGLTGGSRILLFPAGECNGSFCVAFSYAGTATFVPAWAAVVAAILKLGASLLAPLPDPIGCPLFVALNSPMATAKAMQVRCLAGWDHL